jgi:hypothetical protein
MRLKTNVIFDIPIFGTFLVLMVGVIGCILLFMIHGLNWIIDHRWQVVFGGMLLGLTVVCYYVAYWDIANDIANLCH